MLDDILKPQRKRPKKTVEEKIKTISLPEAAEGPELEADQEPEFIPPDQIKDTEDEEMPSDKKDEKLTASDKGKLGKERPHPILALKAWWGKLTQKQRIAFVTGLLSALFALVAGTYAFWPRGSEAPASPVAKQETKPPAPKPTTEASKLTGLQVGFDVNKRPVIGVMIENSPDSRPQSGLRDAGVVYEAIAEGGITRFLALFLDNTPDYVGPVRSARPYYLRWALTYDAPYAHVGGSAKALEDISKLSVKDMNQFFDPGPFHRIDSRYAPHNVYTGIDKLLDLAKSKGWTSSEFIGFQRIKEPKPKDIKPESLNAISVDLAISHELYNVHYDYDKESNTYKRSLGGQSHTDEQSGKQLSPKVVVALITDQGYESDGLHLTYRTEGTGQAFIFQNGHVSKGEWNKKGESAPLNFRYPDGKELKLIPGQVWVTVLGSSDEVSYN